jgi:hypothetical protein
VQQNTFPLSIAVMLFTQVSAKFGLVSLMRRQKSCEIEVVRGNTKLGNATENDTSSIRPSVRAQRAQRNRDGHTAHGQASTLKKIAKLSDFVIGKPGPKQTRRNHRVARIITIASP